MTICLANTPVLQTANLTLRAPGPQDWPAWREFALSDRSQFIGGPYTDGTAWRAFGHAIGHWVMRGYGSFVITRNTDDTPLGMTGPWHPANWPEPELGWTIWNTDTEGKGIAFEAASAARRYAYDVLGWSAPVSYIDHGNTRSEALALRLGATLDTNAQQPASDRSCLVYRHPPCEALS